MNKEEQHKDAFALVIFGVTGNLTQIKLIPALYDMAAAGVLPKKISIVGVADNLKSDRELRNFFRKALDTENKHHKHEVKESIFGDLASRLYCVNGDFKDRDLYPRLKNKLDSLTKRGVHCENRIFYLATYPSLYGDILDNLKKNNLDKREKCWSRIMIEKPIGNNLESARQINNLLGKYFSEEQIYRVDHYLGKETIQNILAFRFGNGIFEHIINNEYIDHIQIIAAEDFGVGQRGGYYDSVGALKDVGQNHQLQMLALTTMEPPSEFSNKSVTDKRLKNLEELIPDPKKVVFGQYEGYLKEKDVAPDSKTDTFYALKTELDNERFRGVPIYIRAGKMLARTVTEVSFIFKVTGERLFKEFEFGMNPNTLIYRVQPNEGIVLKFLAKKPGHKIELDPTYMQFCYKQDPHFKALPDPYEKLIADTLRGDQTFFNSAREVEAQWKFIDPLFAPRKDPFIYKPGAWGPKEADEIIKKDGRDWLTPSLEFCEF